MTHRPLTLQHRLLTAALYAALMVALIGFGGWVAPATEILEAMK